MNATSVLVEGWLKIQYVGTSGWKKTYCKASSDGRIYLFTKAQDTEPDRSIDIRGLTVTPTGDGSGDHWTIKNGTDLISTFQTEVKREGVKWMNVLVQLSIMERPAIKTGSSTGQESQAVEEDQEIVYEAGDREGSIRDSLRARLATVTGNISIPTITFNAMEWKNVTYPDGRVARCQNILREGAVNHGTINWNDGSVYSGQISDGKPHGYGVYVDAMNNRYIGQHLNGKKHGLGVYEWRDGDIYAGQYKNDSENGKGAWESTGGSYYVGEYQDGQWNGYGQSQSEDGKIVKALFKDGAPSKLMNKAVTENERDVAQELVNRAKLIKEEALGVIAQAEGASAYAKAYVEIGNRETESMRIKKEATERLSYIRNLCLLEQRVIMASTYEENRGETLGDLSFPAGATIAIYSCRTDRKWFGELHGSFGFFPKEKIDISSMAYPQDAKLAQEILQKSDQIGKITIQMLELVSKPEATEPEILNQAKYVGVGLLSAKKSITDLANKFSSGIVGRVSVDNTIKDIQAFIVDSLQFYELTRFSTDDVLQFEALAVTLSKTLYSLIRSLN